MSSDRSAAPVGRWVGVVLLALVTVAGVAWAVAQLLGAEATDPMVILAALGEAWRTRPLPVAVALGAPFVALVIAALIASAGRRAPRAAPAADDGADEPEIAASPVTTPGEAGLQLLALLQREGRFVDFLEESLEPYSDEQVGSAVRAIHEGCRTALKDRLELTPILPGEEGATVTVERGFDPGAIRVTGNVQGSPPYEGVLRHAGWQASRLDLPVQTAKGDAVILAPAEVELP